MLRWTGKQILKYTILFSLLSGCSEFALLSSGSSLAISNNTYAKVYSGVDFATTITTKKDIKTHAYHYVTKAKELKKLVLENIAHDFDGMSASLVETNEVIMWELYQPDESIKLKLITTNNEKIENKEWTTDDWDIHSVLLIFVVLSFLIFLGNVIYLIKYILKCKKEKIKRKIRRKKKKRK